jgi:hypothetical protein
MRVEDLPPFDVIRDQAFQLLGDAADWLRSDTQPGRGPNPAQIAAVRRCFTAIGAAKTALDDAARAADLFVAGALGVPASYTVVDTGEGGRR